MLVGYILAIAKSKYSSIILHMEYQLRVFAVVSGAVLSLVIPTPCHCMYTMLVCMYMCMCGMYVCMYVCVCMYIGILRESVNVSKCSGVAGNTSCK